MPFDLGSALVSGGLGLGSALLGSNAAKSAGQAQANAINQASAQQAAQAAQTRQDLAPWRDVGQGGLYQLADIYGVARPDGSGGMTAPTAFEGTPGYQFRYGEGLRAVNQGASASGMLNSGARLKALLGYGQGQAAQEFGDYRNTLQSLAGVGQTATQQQVASNANTGNNLANLAVQGGANAASSSVGQANAITGGLNNALLGYAYLNNGSPSAPAAPNANPSWWARNFG
jgi:hypothetical protein